MKGLSLAVLVVGLLIPVLSGTGCRLPQKTERAEKEIIKAAPLSPTKETKEETLAELVKAAEAGNPSAQCDLAVAFAEGQGVSQDYKEAARWFRKAAEQGYAAAQSNLGLLFHLGQGVPQDYKEALKWFRKAAGFQLFCTENPDYADSTGFADPADSRKAGMPSIPCIPGIHLMHLARTLRVALPRLLRPLKCM